MIDWTISIGNVIQLVTLVGGAVAMFIGLSYRIKGVEKEMEKLAGVITTLAVQTTEIAHLRQRIEDLERSGVVDAYPKLLKRHQL
jgi:hypothetical protein